jgi:tetratricopeptide (TPR) repeat protein
MLQDHPTADQLDTFLRAGARPADLSITRIVTRHLLADCAVCRSQLASIGWPASRLDRLLHLSGGSLVDDKKTFHSQPDYQRAFAKVEECVAALLPSSQPPSLPPEILLDELERLPAAERLREVATERFAQPSMIRYLTQRSHALRYEDTAKMLHFAELARNAAEACSEAAAGSVRLRADLRAEGWRQLGNSFRICGQLPEAERALDQARSYCDQGTGDPLLRAWLLEQRASLDVFQRRFEEAIELAGEAGRIYRQLGELHNVASTMVQKAIALLYSGKPAAAVDTLNRAVPLIDREKDPYLLLAACHNLVLSYLDLGHPSQALALYFEAKELYREFQDALILLRMAWQEGRLLRDLGFLKGAEQALLQAREGFLERDLAYEVAVVSLDLTAVYVRLGKVDQVGRTVAETLPIFRALRVGRETLAALLQLQKMADREQEALSLIQLLTQRLEQLSKPAKSGDKPGDS